MELDADTELDAELACEELADALSVELIIDPELACEDVVWPPPAPVVPKTSPAFGVHAITSKGISVPATRDERIGFTFAPPSG